MQSSFMTYDGHLLQLLPNQIFVFGSNTEGRHGKGAAKTAMRFGARYGQAEGPQGRTYAIVTKNLRAKTHPSIAVGRITKQIIALYMYAQDHPDQQFMVAYGTGKNLNGYTPQQMAIMFAVQQPPDNIVFERYFGLLVDKYLNERTNF
jgi:hypothetical protein